MKKVVTFINMKGGVGKTTLAVNVGYVLSKVYNKKVLLIDIDPQMNATQYVLEEEQVNAILENPKKSIYGILERKSIHPTVISSEEQQESATFEGVFEVSKNFSIIPSHLQIIEPPSDNLEKLNKHIEKHFADKFDVIIIDSPPTISVYTRIALLASNYYVVPMTTDYLSLFGLPMLENYILELQKEYDLDLEFLGIILNQVHPTYTIYQTIKSKIKEKAPRWATKIFDGELKETTIISNAFSQKNINSQSQYLIELNNPEITEQITAISQEIMQKMRL